jgi:hypothetical protein
VGGAKTRARAFASIKEHAAKDKERRDHLRFERRAARAARLRVAVQCVMARLERPRVAANKASSPGPNSDDDGDDDLRPPRCSVLRRGANKALAMWAGDVSVRLRQL